MSPYRPLVVSVIDMLGFTLTQRSVAELTKKPVEGFSAGLVDDDNVFEWQLTIIGPPDTL